MRFDAARDVLGEALATRAFPAVSVEVGTGDGIVWQYAAGRLTYEPDAPAASSDTIFDLASLTKVIVTTTLAMRAAEDGRLPIDELVARRLPEWAGRDRENVTVRDLLAHCSGLTAWLPFHRDHEGRREFQHAICSLPLEYPPRTRSIYSDLGFILLAFILEDAGGRPLDAQFSELARAFTVGDDVLVFKPPPAWRPRIAPTETEAWRGRLLIGETHDENAYALGGVAGHAGLFGTAAAVGSFARAVLRTLSDGRGSGGLAAPATMQAFITRTDVPASSRALGWDTMLPTSSCGTRMSQRAFGHTGFTGTSLWIDPDAAVYIVLLTNRVHPTRENDAIRAVRPRFHDAVMEEITQG